MGRTACKEPQCLDKGEIYLVCNLPHLPFVIYRILRWLLDILENLLTPAIYTQLFGPGRSKGVAALTDRMKAELQHKTCLQADSRKASVVALKEERRVNPLALEMDI